MKDIVEETRLVEAANFALTVKLMAHTTVASLRYLKELSEQLGIPIADLQPAHVVGDLKRENQKQRAHQVEASAIDGRMHCVASERRNKAPKPIAPAHL
jgi:hypothetical protein